MTSQSIWRRSEEVSAPCPRLFGLNIALIVFVTLFWAHSMEAATNYLVRTPLTFVESPETRLLTQESRGNAHAFRRLGVSELCGLSGTKCDR
jgi:hypothetical protein